MFVEVVVTGTVQGCWWGRHQDFEKPLLAVAARYRILLGHHICVAHPDGRGAARQSSESSPCQLVFLGKDVAS